MTVLTKTQRLILTRAVTRAWNLALPLSKGLVGAAAKMAVGRMISHGWLEEVEANLRRGEPLWRETGDGHETTEAGLAAIGIDSAATSAILDARKAMAEMEPMPPSHAADSARPVAIRVGTKQALIIAMLQRAEGAAVAEMVEITG